MRHRPQFLLIELLGKDEPCVRIQLRRRVSLNQRGAVMKSLTNDPASDTRRRLVLRRLRHSQKLTINIGAGDALQL